MYFTSAYFLLTGHQLYLTSSHPKLLLINPLYFYRQLQMAAFVFTDPPLPETVALNTKYLVVLSESAVQAPLKTSACPMNIGNADKHIQHIPVEASVALEARRVHQFLARELNTPILDELYPRLWLIANNLGSNINPLHGHILKSRETIPSEDPKLHLVWRAHHL